MAHYEKPDFWSIKAQKEGYPARSVYKLKEIDEKFSFFKSSYQKTIFKQNAGQTNPVKVNTPALRVLDLGAAPGSWSLYILNKYGKRPGALFLAAVDLQPLQENSVFSGRDNFFFIQGDFTGSPARDELLSRGPYTTVISDAAPPTTGSRTVDTQRSFLLAEEAFSFANSCLVSGSNLAVKVFQGAETNALLKRFREFFDSAKSFKPAACRSNSFETYLLGFGKKV